MRAPLSPFSRCIERNIDDVMQQAGGLRDCIGYTSDSHGALDGIYESGAEATFLAGATPTRWLVWDNRTVLLNTTPVSTVQIDDSGTPRSGPAGEGRGVLHEHVAPVAVKDAQAVVLVDSTKSNPFTDGFCYLSRKITEGLITTTSTALGVTTVNFDATYYPQMTTGNVPIYILFDRDADANATTATVRAITGYNTSGDDITDVTYTGDGPPADSLYGRVILGTSASDTFGPDGFFRFREALGAYEANNLYFAGYPGNATPPVDPAPEDWTYWDGLNITKIGDSAQGNIQAVVQVGDELVVALESAIYRVYGYPPIDAAIQNQLVVQLLSDEIGITGPDAIAVSPDGRKGYLAGSDGNLYITAGGTIEPIGREIRRHERRRNIDFVAATDSKVLFASNTTDAEKVPTEAAGVPAGLIHQYPSAFVLNTESNTWTSFVRVGTDTTGKLVPFDDVGRQGGFGTYRKGGRKYLAVGSGESIKILNDPAVTSADVTSWYCQGLATHQLAAGGPELKRVDSLIVQAQSPLTRQLFATAPAQDPAGSAGASISSCEPQRTFGNISSYELFMRDTFAAHYVSAALGYWGEDLIYGLNSWPNARYDQSVSTRLLESRYLSGQVSRIDVLCHTVTDLTLYVFGDNAGAPDTSNLIYSVAVTAPKSGLTASTDPFWRSFDVRFPFVAGDYWVGLSGTATVMTYEGSGNLVDDANTTQAALRNFCARIIRERGGPFVAHRLLGVTANFEQVGGATF